MSVEFKLEETINARTGSKVISLVKYHENKEREEWCTMDDLDALFDACSNRWATNWNLDKVLTVIKESEIE